MVLKSPSHNNILFTVADVDAAKKLKAQVDEACSMLTDYNSRLADELQERRRVAKMLKEYIIAQKQMMSDSEKLLQVCCFCHSVICIVIFI